MTETTADMDVTAEEQPTPVKRDNSTVLPGDLSAKLKACREKAEMDMEQAAVEMRLSISMIKALEAEKFSELPDPPYVRGYLRSYSRLDGSDPKDLIRTYELLRGADPDSFALSPSTQLHRVAKPAISPSTLKLLGLALLVLFLGILSMIPGVNQWATDTWKDFSAKTAETHPQTAENEALVAELTREPADATSATSTDKPADTSDAGGTSNTDSAATLAPVTLATSTQDSTSTDITGTALTLPGTTAETEESDSPDAELAAGDTQDTAAPPAEGAGQTDTTAANSAAPASTVTESADTAATTAPAATSTDVTPVATAGTAVTPATPEGAATPQTPPPDTANNASTDATAQQDATQPVGRQQPIDGEVIVRMEFNQEVWMQVKDGNKKSIFEALNTAGTWKQFKARTPLSFKVGNTAGVRIYLNGQLFDQAPHSRGNVSRFNID